MRLLTASVMDDHRLMKVATTINMAALFLFVVFAVTSSVAGSGLYYDDALPVVERRGGNPACRRCVLNRHDWTSCTACFRYARRGSARIPYYGLRKRSSLDDNECCEVTGNPECCSHVGYRHGPASLARHVPMLESQEYDSSIPLCSCCDRVLYDAVCCQLGCEV